MTRVNNGIRVQFDADGSLSVLATTPGRTGTFTYRISDGANIVTGSLTIVVTANQPPVANPDTFTIPASTRFGNYITIPAPGVLANDTDPEGSPLRVVGIFDQQSNGIQVRINRDGSLLVRGTTPGRTATFTYRISDGANTVAGSLTISVTVNQPPVANPDTFTIPASGSFITIPAPGVLANDTDPEGRPLVVVVGSQPTMYGIRIQLDEDGSLRVLGTIPGRTGTFTYRISDGVNTVTGSLTIIVRSG